MKATNNGPVTRTVNMHCTGSCVGSKADWTKFNPWRVRGHAHIYDPCQWLLQGNVWEGRVHQHDNVVR
jgi:hypothetical protein